MTGPVTMPHPESATPVGERPVGLVRGTRDRLPDEYARLARLERQLLDGFARAGYVPLPRLSSNSPNCTSARAARASCPSCSRCPVARLRSACGPSSRPASSGLSPKRPSALPCPAREQLGTGVSL